MLPPVVHFEKDIDRAHSSTWFWQIWYNWGKTPNYIFLHHPWYWPRSCGERKVPQATIAGNVNWHAHAYWHRDIAVTKKVNHSLAFLMRNLPLKIKAVLWDTGQTHHGVCQFTMKPPHQDQRPTARHCPATGHMIHGWYVPIWEWHNDQWLHTYCSTAHYRTILAVSVARRHPPYREALWQSRVI